MKPLLCIPFNGYFFWGRVGTGIIKNCQCQKTITLSRHYCGVRAVREIRPEVCCKPILNSRKLKTFDVRKRFASNNSSNVVLMNYDVWLQPKLIPYFKDIYYFNVGLKNVDETFSLPQFKLCSIKALEVVTNLLSQRRFSELEGLLTPECRKEVEENLTKNWKVSQVKVLAVHPDSVLLCAPCEVVVFPDKTNSEKTYVEIRVIHYVWIQYASEFFNDPQINDMISFKFFNQKVDRGILMGVVFNSKFITEITNGRSSAWTISAINLRKLPGMFATME